ncbi:hypothetical protein EMIHUDRAFT_204357 [Emiliania huxleyi CCMP1516]|uniref:Uncharacterized protein n=2 Tax=Emiliania huxleyi TaxID=2903 RepID=A0A0D3I2S1_EMIH1|nr:hypothetical protein EMIHUDRAFT_250229 [Emiliania huxleyi CCMP1516]XP_005780902.1 hypothetical protein EMIHUDRAFT_204357 [Emiliania huxleyi CCMP1516]EOD05556.1 hypothetical protein EMIHUDRAFT_250229 [Emiliania huxleyi CCMP1516]EOD28473.1 hypothetical protein EMIHUDRAFT_204357 [Emiliania huxleyi CCMP1516]|eukprot:XP_005757985.1 hypothetical protein EMIHUDRAFT_250229 [Emiliania huxleyi CCMP1516]
MSASAVAAGESDSLRPGVKRCTILLWLMRCCCWPRHEYKSRGRKVLDEIEMEFVDDPEDDDFGLSSFAEPGRPASWERPVASGVPGDVPQDAASGATRRTSDRAILLSESGARTESEGTL